MYLDEIDTIAHRRKPKLPCAPDTRQGPRRSPAAFDRLNSEMLEQVGDEVLDPVQHGLCGALVVGVPVSLHRRATDRAPGRNLLLLGRVIEADPAQRRVCLLQPAQGEAVCAGPSSLRVISRTA